MRSVPIKIGEVEISQPFTIPSGIITTTPPVLKYFAEAVQELGFLTTKSIGPKAREGFDEPILAQFSLHDFLNAVGLANPGADAWIEEAKEIYPLPAGKKLSTSIFGNNTAEYREVALKVAPFTDMIELNLSCPHAGGVDGKCALAQLGKSPEATAEVVGAVKDAVAEYKRPVIAKLTPMADDIGAVAKAAVEAGADGLSLINTVGPNLYIEPYSGKPVLSNKFGGQSGRGIFATALRCAQKAREAVGQGTPIIFMGGIEVAENILSAKAGGADLFGIGTVLAGKSTPQVVRYLKRFFESSRPPRPTDDWLIRYEPFEITEIKQHGENLKTFRLDKKTNCCAGQFFFLWLPEIGEKPFAVADDDPLTFFIRKVGKFTSALFELEEGSKIYGRGPYGNCFDTYFLEYFPDTCLVGGGTGISALHQYVKMMEDKKDKINVFLGAKTKRQLPFLEGFKKMSAELFIATEDGSLGYKGLVTDLLKSKLKEKERDTQKLHFVNCGPELMEAAALKIEANYTEAKNIETSVERYMKCGIGICGLCSLDGLRTCVDGSIFRGDVLLRSKEFGKYCRDRTGHRIPVTH